MLGVKAANYIAHKGPCEGRIVLHSDLNNFFASAEASENPELKKVPCAVCGNIEERHGIVLAKNELAKKYGIKTGQVIWQAKKACPNLVIVPPNYSLYLKFSKYVQKIYCDYSDRIESFGIDEAWIELTGCPGIKTISDGEKTANEIRKRIFAETGLTVSIGVSDNKTFAKLASDYKKPDAITVFSPDNFEQTICNIEISELLYVGKATTNKLNEVGIRTIGDTATASEAFLKSMLGKNGTHLSASSCGYDISPVEGYQNEREIKSIGNSTTPMRDLQSVDDVKCVCFLLAEEVCTRLREHGLKCKTLAIHMRTASSLIVMERQCTLPLACNTVTDFSKAAMALFTKSYNWKESLRSFGVRACNLVSATNDAQLCFFEKEEKAEKYHRIDRAVDQIRSRFGDSSVRRAILLCRDVPCQSNGKNITCSFQSINLE
jgi:Nucleotidyltransferase/DNA polymerase involved in DNA repair